LSAEAFAEFIGASAKDRLDLFLTTANRLGTPVGNVEKDFWVCWTLDALYHRLPAGQPRMLFKGGTSLSKAYGLIQRFSEDIDVTVFRDDLGQSATIAEFEALSGNRRREKLDAIRDACRAYITGPLREALAELVTEATSGAGRIEIDKADPDQQTLLVWYPEVEPRDGAYVQPAVRIESGAKSALDPHQLVSISPYVGDDLPSLDLTVTGVTTIEARRTFWDKIVILHGLRRWFENRGELKGGGHRISRHYYDLFQLMQSPVGKEAVNDAALGADCVEHARMFFNRAPFDLASARPPTFALMPENQKMLEGLRRDYTPMTTMIFGEPPRFDAIIQSVASVEQAINRASSPD
jgi:hypothetical protein